MSRLEDYIGLASSRRRFLKKTSLGLGSIALANLINPAKGLARETALEGYHFTPRAKRVIYLFQSGAPSQIELFDYKPELTKRWGEEIPDSVRGDQRLTGMLAAQSSFPLVGSPFAFTRHAQTGGWFSSLVPHTAGIAEDICV